MQTDCTQQAGRRLKTGCVAAAVAVTLERAKASLTNWLRGDARGPVDGAIRRPSHNADDHVREVEITCLRALLARLTMPRDIAKNRQGCRFSALLASAPPWDRASGRRLYQSFHQGSVLCRNSCWMSRSG
jgi:transposase